MYVVLKLRDNPVDPGEGQGRGGAIMDIYIVNKVKSILRSHYSCLQTLHKCPV